MRKLRLLPLRRLLLWLALGPRTYDYMKRVLSDDHRLRTSRQVDIVIRKDGTERRIEADWVKQLGTVVLGRWRSPLALKRGPFTRVGDVVAWLEQHGWKRRIGDPCNRSFPYDHLAVLGVEKLKAYKPPPTKDDHETPNKRKSKDEP